MAKTYPTLAKRAAVRNPVQDATYVDPTVAHSPIAPKPVTPAAPAPLATHADSVAAVRANPLNTMPSRGFSPQVIKEAQAQTADSVAMAKYNADHARPAAVKNAEFASQQARMDVVDSTKKAGGNPLRQPGITQATVDSAAKRATRVADNTVITDAYQKADAEKKAKLDSTLNAWSKTPAMAPKKTGR